MKKRTLKRAAFAVTAAFALQVFSPLGAVSASSGVTINATNFPDKTFREYVSKKFDTDHDGSLSQVEIDTVTAIDVSGSSKTPNTVADLTGIEYFTKLTRLYCYYNQLTSLDVSNNIALKDLACYNNQLTSLNVSNNTALIFLNCHNNQLTSLNVSNKTALTHLDCTKNQLASLNVSNNTALITLNCNNNQLTRLDLSDNTNLQYLFCYENQLTSLDLSNNIALKHLNCHNNQLTRLDLSDNTNLDYLFCFENKLTSLDLSNNAALTTLNCNNNQLTSLDLSKNTALKNPDCAKNTYPIIVTEGSFYLGDLPKGFNPEKASNWKGAVYDSETNSLKNFTSDTVTYTYDCGRSKTATFTLNCSVIRLSSVTVNSDNVVVTYEDEATETYSFDEVPVTIIDYIIKNDFDLCVAFVNAFTADEDTLILSDAQLKAIEAVLASDYGA